MIPKLAKQIDATIETDIDVYMEERENEHFKWGEPSEQIDWLDESY